MKKSLCAGVLAGIMALTAAAPGLAATTSVALDGKVYVFSGGEGSYQAEGKRFIIGADSVTVEEAGKADKVFPLDSTAEADVTAVQGGTGYAPPDRAEEAEATALETGDILTEGVQSIQTSGTDEPAARVRDSGETVLAEAVESGNALSQEEKRALTAAYAGVGITYDESADRLYCDGKLVRRFTDIRQVEAGADAEGKRVVSALFLNEEDGEVDVEIIRDFTRPDAQGDGALTGAIVTPAD